MTKLPGLWLPLAAALALAACAPHAAPPPPTTQVATTPLTLDLAALWPARRLLAASALPRAARITIAGPDLATLVEATHDLAAAGTLVALGGVPSGERMFVKVVGLDEQDRPIPGQTFRAIGRIGPGPTTMGLGPMPDAAGRVIEALVAEDRRLGTTVTTRLDFAALDRAMPRFARELRLSAPGLLDAGAIAREIHAANGAVPLPRTAHVLQAGRLILSPAAWPPGATATVLLDDPAAPATPVEGKPAVIGPVAPGTWTLTVLPDQPGLAPITQRVTVAPGADVRVAVGFGTTETLPRLASPLGATASGVLPIQGGEALILAGGATVGPAGPQPVGALPAAQVVRFPATAPVPPLPLTEPVAAPAAAVAVGRLYWFGGLGTAGARSAGWSYNPAGAGQVTARAALPNGAGLLGAAAATIGDRIYLTGGLRADRSPANATMAYDVATDAWQVAGGPPLSPHRSDMAGAVVGGVWYLFGGFGDAGLVAPQPGGPIQAVTTVSAWKPGDDGHRAMAPLPTPRAGASAVAVGTRIWVMGGVARDGALTGAVEVYDTVADSWSLRAPLQRPRAYAAAGVLDGKIVVAGGLLGVDASNDLPVDDVEAIAP